jgi:phenylalanyl-tRNA synthetase alpha chain
MDVENIKKLEKDGLAAIHGVTDEVALEALRVEYLGRNGKITQILKGLKDLSEDERRKFGPLANSLRAVIETALTKKGAEIARSAVHGKLKVEKIDITLPGKKIPVGRLHPLTQLRREVENIFTRMGFDVAEGPEVETEYYNFDALNVPADHPARDMWDTFWIKPTTHDKQQTTSASHQSSVIGRKLMRTHTSPVQIRYMESHQPPFRVIAPGKVFRYEATDASHDIEFFQVEGLAVGKDISVANLKDAMLALFRGLFGREVKIRLRPSFFPFVEPGFEVDMSCIQCKGKGCPVCKHSGFVEVMGAGMVHPNVLRTAGYDPREWRGYAFGVGLDRIAMMKYHIPDIRFFHANDIRFLKQF